MAGFDSLMEQSSVDSEKYIFVPGKRANSQLLWFIDEKQFYRVSRKKDDRTFHECRFDGCKARVVISNIGKISRTNASVLYNHPACEAEYAQLEVENNIKAQCGAIEFRHRGRHRLLQMFAKFLTQI